MTPVLLRLLLPALAIALAWNLILVRAHGAIPGGYSLGLAVSAFVNFIVSLRGKT